MGILAQVSKLLNSFVLLSRCPSIRQITDLEFISTVFNEWLKYPTSESTVLYPKIVSPVDYLKPGSKYPLRKQLELERQMSRVLLRYPYGRVNYLNGGIEIARLMNKDKKQRKNVAALVIYRTGHHSESTSSMHVSILYVTATNPREMFFFDPMRGEANLTKEILLLKQGLKITHELPSKIAFGTQSSSYDCLLRGMEMLALILGGLNLEECAFLRFETMSGV